jgi:hypothetical protein
MTAPTVDATTPDGLLAGAEWPAPEPVTPDDTPEDPHAPYGRRADGTPRAKPGRRPSSGKAPPPPPRKATSGRTPPPRSPKRVDYRPGVVSLLSLPAGLLGAAGAGLQRPELVADAATIMTAAPALAEGVHQLAGQEPRIAAVLDRVLAAGPWGALISAMVPMIAQLAANHGIIRPGMLGTRTRDEMIASFGGSGAGPNLRP